MSDHHASTSKAAATRPAPFLFAGRATAMHQGSARAAALGLFRCASGTDRSERFGHDIFIFAAPVAPRDLDSAHQFIRQVERGLHITQHTVFYALPGYLVSPGSVWNLVLYSKPWPPRWARYSSRAACPQQCADCPGRRVQRGAGCRRKTRISPSTVGPGSAVQGQRSAQRGWARCL